MRWSVSPPQALIAAILNDFEGIYQYENITPHTNVMVMDNKYGLYFHSRMTSKDKVYVHSEEERRSIYTEEFKKIQYLVEKQNRLLATGERVFVYKHNAGVSDDILRQLGQAIASKGPGKLLYVTDKGGGCVGNVTNFGSNIHIGKIDSFASYAQANKPSREGWMAVLRNYVEHG